MINLLKEMKEMASGFEAYSVNLVLKEREPKEIKDILIVSEFVEVFKELLGLILLEKLSFDGHRTRDSSSTQDAL